MTLVLLLALVLSGGFRESSTCIVQGYVYGMPGEESAFTRADGCREIRTEVKDNLLFMYSPQTWVAIVLPVSGGQQRFQYRWGAEFAHIGPQDYPVAFGRIVNG